MTKVEKLLHLLYPNVPSEEWEEFEQDVLQVESTEINVKIFEDLNLRDIQDAMEIAGINPCLASFATSYQDVVLKIITF